MKLSDLKKVDELRRKLEDAQAVVTAFEQERNDMVTVQAMTFVDAQGMTRQHTVFLPPVPKIMAVTAAHHVRERIINELKDLGVEL
jgi:hypothetical protein